jgi:paraquat-inducible protein B
MAEVTLQSLSRQIVDFAVAIDSRVESLDAHVASQLADLVSRVDSLDHRLDRIEAKLDGLVAGRSATHRSTRKRR